MITIIHVWLQKTAYSFLSVENNIRYNKDLLLESKQEQENGFHSFLCVFVLYGWLAST